MTSPTIPTGKLPPQLLTQLLSTAPPLPEEVLVGPQVGEDAAAIRLPAGVLVAATDPITMTGSEVGAHAVHINANDVAVTGVRPRWFLASVMLPSGTTEADVTNLFDSMCEALQLLDVALVGGHTEVTPAVNQALVVGQMLGFSETGRTVSTGGLRAGDYVVQIGVAPVEGAAILANGLGDRLAALPPATLQLARDAIRTPGISVVDAALYATQLGATALHDPTESGLSGGLYEMAHAAGVRIQLDPDAVLWFAPGVAVCEALDVNPWGLLASGTVLAGFAAESWATASQGLTRAGHTNAVIGRAVDGVGVTLPGTDALEQFPRDELARLFESLA
ncbi:MAG: hypothetical protein HOI95_12225 [Chromatiales bacterium]|nr:hypothetical protein [Chromatiales bacterium]